MAGGLRLGEEADASEVDAQHRDLDVAGEFGGAQERAVAAEDQHHLAALGGALVGVDDLDLGAEALTSSAPGGAAGGRPARRRAPAARCRSRRAPSPRGERCRWPRRGRCGRRAGRGVRRSLWPFFDGAAYGAAPGRRPWSGRSVCARRRRKNSTLPDGPGSGLAVTSTVCQSSSAARRATDSTASARICGIRHDAARPDAVLAHLELRLHHGNDIGVRRRAGHQRGQHRRQRDERQVGDDEVDRAADGVGGQRADVGALHHHHRGVGAQRPGQLAVADVGGDHLAGPAIQQHLGEAAGRRAGVQAAPASTGTSKASRAPISLCAPRDTQLRSSAPVTVSFASTATAVAGFAAGMPSMRTRPAPISSAACWRDRASRVAPARHQRERAESRVLPLDRFQRPDQQVVRLLQRAPRCLDVDVLASRRPGSGSSASKAATLARI